MSAIFARRYAPSLWNPQMLGGPCPTLTLREWEVSVILCSLSPAIKHALLAWLIAPTSPHWPRPDSFSRHLLPFSADDLREPDHPLPTRLWDEMKAIRQTLDTPLEALHASAAICS